MAKAELGTKRVCPETGRKFYDLNKDPIVSPYTGVSYPLSYFQDKVSAIKARDVEEQEEKELDDEDEIEVDVVSLEDVEEDDTTGGAKGAAAPADDLVEDDEDIDLGDDDDDPFLADAEEDEDEDDVSGIISVGGKDDED